MKKGFIDRSPLSFVAGILMLIVALLSKSVPLGVLGFFDIGIGFISFLKPELGDKKTVKLAVFITYGVLLVWTALWLITKLS